MLSSLPYITVYQVRGEVLYVVRILRSAQDWPFLEVLIEAGASKGWEESSNDETHGDFCAFAVGNSRACAGQETNNAA